MYFDWHAEVHQKQLVSFSQRPTSALALCSLFHDFACQARLDKKQGLNPPASNLWSLFTCRSEECVVRSILSISFHFRKRLAGTKSRVVRGEAFSHAWLIWRVHSNCRTNWRCHPGLSRFYNWLWFSTTPVSHLVMVGVQFCQLAIYDGCLEHNVTRENTRRCYSTTTYTPAHPPVI